MIGKKWEKVWSWIESGIEYSVEHDIAGNKTMVRAIEVGNFLYGE